MNYELRMVAIDRLKPNPKNARTHPRTQINNLRKIMGEVGFGAPIITDENHVLLAGHARLAAAKLRGLREIPTIVWSGLSEAKKRAILLADNKLAEKAGWDRKRLAMELPEVLELLSAENLDFDLTGFAMAELDSILQDFEESAHDPADELDPTWSDSPPVSRRGDSWLLAEHCLLCGDATNEQDFEKLLSREQARMMFTDPPYNVKIRDVVGRGRKKYREFLEASGEKSHAEFIRFLEIALRLAAGHSYENALHYVFMDWRHLPHLFRAAGDVYAEMLNLIVWDKTNAGQGSFYRSQHELIGLYRVGRGQHINNIELGKHGRNRSNVWRYAGQNAFGKTRLDDLHPTMKPVALIADAIKDCTKRGDIVLDPFCGSGTTILAAEKVGRHARCLEIDCCYVDLAIRRWQAFTKKDAVDKATGLTFDELADGRIRESSTRVRLLRRTAGATRSPKPDRNANPRRRSLP